MRIVLAAALLLAGCTKNNPNYCSDGGGPCGQACTASQGTCVCLTPPGVCVECTAEDEHNCANTRPQCGDDNRCRACRSNDECASGACLEDGSCANESEVIYVAANGAATAGCGRKAGQTECSLVQALAEVAPGRDIIRLASGSYTVPTGIDGLDFSAQGATVIARGATITRTGTGAIMSARAGKTLKLVGGTLLGPTAGDGLRCNTDGKLLVHETTIDRMGESGIETDACELTVSRATIRNNSGGGIKMVNTHRSVTITNNFVYRNGGPGSPIGGMSLRVVPAGTRVEYNTVVDNESDTGGASAGGIICDGQGYNGPFNLVYRNRGGLDGTYQVIGTCTFQSSFQQAASTPTANEPGFENPAGASPSYRLTPASPVETILDGFDCRDNDFDGEPRPSPTGGKCDYGADELTRP